MSDLVAISIFILGVAVVILNTIYMIDNLKRLRRNRKLFDEQLARVLKVLRKEDDV